MKAERANRRTLHLLLAVEVSREQDVVLARQRARQVAALLRFPPAETTRVATAVSEIARNAWKYAGGGRVELGLDECDPPALSITIRDRGKGIAHLNEILEGRYRSQTGMGIGIIGSRRLVDRFEVTSSPQGTTVLLQKDLPVASRDLRASDLGRLAEELARAGHNDPIEELTSQNQELLRTLEELRVRDRELLALNKELEDTNRGVVALYAELDEKADYLRRASELKSHFLSNMSHEFRTPLSTILSFCRLLLDEVDGPLNEEQRRQVGFARKAADGMLDLVNDLLDLAKVEAGKTVVRRAPFEVKELFGALRGMLRPLLAARAIDLVFEEPVGLPLLETDEGKVSQILRNFVSNALKFTERGEVRVSAQRRGDRVVFAVADTGIGIAPEDQEVIFQEYTQLDSQVQRRVRGTGLGLPLSRRLAELLGGRILLQSEVGVGSTFFLELPAVYDGPAEVPTISEIVRLHDPTRHTVLVLEDNPETVLIYEKYLRGTPFQVIPVSTTAEARRLVCELHPLAMVLDIMLASESAWSLLAELKGNAATRRMPVFVVTMVDNPHKARALGADDYCEKPLDRSWLLDRLRRAAEPVPRERVLLVDDDQAARDVLRDLLAETRYEVVEAASGGQGLELARALTPAAVFLDLQTPDIPGEEVLRRLQQEQVTRRLPVIVYTGRDIDPAAPVWIEGAAAVLSKRAPSRAAALQQVREALSRCRTLAEERRTQ